MFIDNLYDFFKKIKYKLILSVFLCPFFLLCTSISGFAAEVSPDAFTEWFLLPFDKVYFDDSPSSSFVGDFSVSSGTYNGSFTGSGDWLIFACSDIGAVMPSLNSGHEYLLYYTFSIHSNSLIDINRVVFRFDQSSVASSSGNLPIISSTNNLVTNTSTCTGIVKFATDSIGGGDKILSTSSGLWFNLNDTYSSYGRVSWAFYILDITDNSDSEVNQIVAAINNQTTNIMNAGSGFGGTTSGIQSGNNELSGFIDDYTEVEQSMYDKFTENQSAVSGNFSGWSWGSLSTAVDWTSDYLNRIYDNSGDFRTMFMYPILAGIALIFIGRQGLTAYVRSRREK